MFKLIQELKEKGQDSLCRGDTVSGNPSLTAQNTAMSVGYLQALDIILNAELLEKGEEHEERTEL